MTRFQEHHRKCEVMSPEGKVKILSSNTLELLNKSKAHFLRYCNCDMIDNYWNLLKYQIFSKSK